MDETETRIMSVRDARAHLAEIVTGATDGNPTLITRNGEPVAAVVSLEEYEIIEEVIDEAFSRRADKIIQEESGEQLHSMTEIIADLFDAHRLPRGAA
ncbi:MAG: type II toxin-antitoxin system Phd/YefM family antitoxin [Actinopolymorphaceae bacterium]